MKHLFCIVKRILCDFVYRTNCRKHAEIFEKSALLMICDIRVLKMHTLLVKIIPK